MFATAKTTANSALIPDGCVRLRSKVARHTVLVDSVAKKAPAEAAK
jgi:hypothetical protein